ncbi:MAG: S-layer homology domain-containing protein [Oscillospiraceae bacterium]|nr:S-layer homology domain-containing protein [Oscillospiraceae bacterium]
MKKKALALVLVLCMVLSMLPMTAFAAQPKPAPAGGMMMPTSVGKLEPAAVQPNAKSYSVSLTSSGNGDAELLVDSPAAVGSEVYFLADPDDGYLAEIYYEGLSEDALVYVGADIVGFIMPANRVKLQVKFVEAEGNSHGIDVFEQGRGDYDQSRYNAKQYESVLLAVLPDDAAAFDPLTHVYVSSGTLLYLDEDDGIHYYELIMPDEHVTVIVAYGKVGPNHIGMLYVPEGGTVTFEPQKAYFLDTVTVTIVPDPGYRLVRAWAYSHAGDFISEMTPIGGNKYTFVMHAEEVTLDVIFEPILNPVTVRHSSGGTASADVTTAKVGDTVTVTCKPDDNYRVYSITGAEGIVDNGDNTYSFTMPGKAVTINVTFKTIYNPVSLTVETGLGGTAAVDVETAKAGDTVTLTCQPEEGYRVAQITGVDGLVDNGDNTYTFTMPDDPVDLKVLFLRNENPFLDINETQFFYDSVLWAAENGITGGVDDTHFGPAGVCNRVQVVTFLWAAAGKPAPTLTENPFVDIPDVSWYTDAVLWAYENGITAGSDATHFDPAGECNRAQVVTFLWAAAGKPAPTLTENPFEDVPDGSWYAAPILWALENGITTGSDATHFSPAGQCLRAFAVTFLYKAAQLPPPPVFYAVSAQFDAEMGTVTLSHTEAQAGEIITATVIPAEGYALESVTCLGGTAVTQVSDTEYTFVMPEHDETFVAVFAPIATEPEPTDPEPTDPTEPEPTDPTEPEPTDPVKTYELDLRDNGNGRVAYVDGQTAAAPGESIFFYAVPNEGYYLDHVGIFNPDGTIDVSTIQIHEHGDDLYELIMIPHDLIMTCYFYPIT